MKKLLILIVSFLLLGCTYDCNIKRGMTELEVMEKCGEPTTMYNYVFREGGLWRTWVYNDKGSFYHKSQTTEVLFKDGKVINFSSH